MTLTDFLAKLASVEETADGYLATCPGHADSHASLRVTVGENGRVLVKCRAMCETADVMAALGLTMRDLATMTVGSDVPAAKRATAALPATPGDIAALAVRLDSYAAALADLTDRGDIRRPMGYAEGRFGLTREDAVRLGLGYVDDIGGGPRLVVPFRTPDGVARNFQARALAKDATVRWQGPKSPEGGSWSPLGFFPGSAGWAEVLICEGPGDALTGAAVGYDTIGIAGASRVSNSAIVDEVAQWVGDREAVILGDGDEAGRRFSSTLSRGLVARGVTVRVVEMPDGEDLTDWRARDPHFATSLVRAIGDAAPHTADSAAVAEWDTRRFSLTDVGAARFLREFIRAEGSDVRFTPETGFMLLIDGVWTIDSTQRTRTWAQKVADVARRIARDALNADAKDAGARFAFAKHAQSTRGIDSMLRELQAVEGVPASINDFDQHPDLLAVRNGVVDLRTGELRPHDPELLLSRRIDFDYDPAAKAPRWEAFLDEVFPKDPAMADFMRRLVGYGITGHTTEQCFVIHLGKGANGKSVFLDTITEVFRAITTTTPFATFEAKPSGGIPNDLAALKGARLVMSSEGEQGKRMAEAVLKRVTGRDLIAARFMRQEFFEFRPAFLLQMATNFEPQFRGQDEGLWRRVKLVNWERYFAPHERDPRLSAKLLDEAPGILAWAVRGAREWYASGLGDPTTVVEASRNYRSTSNVLLGFFPGKYVPADDDAHSVPGKTLWDDFRAWAEEENLRDLQGWSQRAFYGALKERGVHQKRANTGATFTGIKRAPRTSAAPEEATPEIARATASTPAVSSASPTITGPDLDGLI